MRGRWIGDPAGRTRTRAAKFVLNIDHLLYEKLRPADRQADEGEEVLPGGLWSPMRGLARSVEQYYARLHNADLPRRNDIDGRGALSQEELVAFADYFLRCCLDQAQFLEAMGFVFPRLWPEAESD